MIKCSFTEADPVSELESEVQIVTGGQPPKASWTLHVDGSSTTKASGAGIILTSPEGFKVQ